MIQILDKKKLIIHDIYKLTPYPSIAKYVDLYYSALSSTPISTPQA